MQLQPLTSSGHFCPVHFARTRDGLMCFTFRKPEFRVDGPGVTLHRLVVNTVYGSSPSHIETGLIRQ